MQTIKIKFFIMDVDGTLTDGKIYMADSGELFKAFDTKDGCGIKDLLLPAGMIPIIMTARNSKIVKNRCQELNITEFYQNCQNKLNKLEEILRLHSIKDNISYSCADCAYIGDDIGDLSCMKLILKSGGLVGCPADAIPAIKEISSFVSSKNGGNGAVREFIEWILMN